MSRPPVTATAHVPAPGQEAIGSVEYAANGSLLLPFAEMIDQSFVSPMTVLIVLTFLARGVRLARCVRLGSSS